MSHTNDDDSEYLKNNGLYQCLEYVLLTIAQECDADRPDLYEHAAQAVERFGKQFDNEKHGPETTLGEMGLMTLPRALPNPPRRSDNKNDLHSDSEPHK